MSGGQNAALVCGTQLHVSYASGRRSFRGRRAEVKAVDGVDIAIAAGETVSLVGESGSANPRWAGC